MYIYILLDTVLATDVNKYSLASVRCQPIWRTKFGELDLFLAVAKEWDVFLPKPITTKHQSVFWLVSQSRRMSAICVGSCRWIELAAACADPVVLSVSSQVNMFVSFLHPPLYIPCISSPHALTFQAFLSLGALYFQLSLNRRLFHIVISMHTVNGN